jgi:hypothetical protein
MPVEPEADPTARMNPIRPVETTPVISEQSEPDPIEVVNEETDHTARTRPVRPVPNEADKQKKKVTEKPPPYRPPVPFPQRLAETRLNEQFFKFIEVMKQLHITIPFTEALTQMPTYAKFLKDILSNKRSLGGHETVKLTEQCSAILRSELPPKLEDPGKFSIPCTIGKATIRRALCDLGASVSLMPRTIFERLGVGELRPTRMTLQLADSSVRLPLGIVEDVPVQVGKFYVPGDFVVMEMEEDKEVPIILGRPFLRTAGALIDVKNGTLTLNIGDEKVHFQIDRAMKYPAQPESCYMIDMVDELVEENFLEQVDNSLRYHFNFLSDLQDETSELETVCTADMTPVCLEESSYGSYPDHTGRTPEEFQTEKLEIEKESKAQAEAEVYGVSS